MNDNNSTVFVYRWKVRIVSAHLVLPCTPSRPGVVTVVVCVVIVVASVDVVAVVVIIIVVIASVDVVIVVTLFVA